MSKYELKYEITNCASNVPVWHNLGVPFENLTQFREAAGFTVGGEWRHYDKYPVQVAGTSLMVAESFALMDQFGEVLPKAVGTQQETFQFQQMEEWAKAFSQEGEAHPETGGRLLAGSEAWLLLKAPGNYTVRRRQGVEDVHEKYLLLHQGMVGNGCLTVGFTDVTVCCKNTAQMALGGMKGSFKRRHTRGIHDAVADAIDALSLAETYFGKVAETFQQLADEPMNKDSFKVFACQYITGEDDAKAAVEVVSKAKDRQLSEIEKQGSVLVELFEHGKGNYGDSKLDALQSVTEFLDHQRQRVRKWKSADAKLASLGWGDSVVKKKRAVRLLTAA